MEYIAIVLFFVIMAFVPKKKNKINKEYELANENVEAIEAEKRERERLKIVKKVQDESDKKLIDKQKREIEEERLAAINQNGDHQLDTKAQAKTTKSYVQPAMSKKKKEQHSNPIHIEKAQETDKPTKDKNSGERKAKSALINKANALKRLK